MSQNIRLRPPAEADSDLLFEWINDRDLVLFNAPYRPIPRAEHDTWFKHIRDRTDLAFFMIDDIAAGAAIGSCQLLNIHPVHRSADLQIRIGVAGSQNRGAGTAAVHQLVELGFGELQLHRIALHAFATNPRAIRVYEKNGFVREGLLRQAACIDGRWLDVICMARVRGLDD